MGFDLEIPDPEEVKDLVKQQTAITPAYAEAVDSAANEKGDQIINVNLDSVASRREITSAVNELGSDIMERSANKNAILAKRMGELSRGGSESGEVAKSLEDLAIKMRDLDPSGIDFAKSGPLASLFNPVRRYFERYKSADGEIADIVKSLDRGRTTLKQDNVTLELEEGAMRDLTKQLNQKLEMAIDLDAYLTSKIEEIRAQGTDDERVKFLEEEVVFPLRQKIMDFQQLQVVNQQGIVAMDVIRSNNKELIRAVDRAETVTVSSLRTAVTVAGALYNQKIVLEKVQLLNESTNAMIQATSKMLKDQGVAIQKQATEANISVETLKVSFENTLSALDDISNYKQEALPKIAQTIEEFRKLADVGEQRLIEMEKRGKFLDIDNLTALEDKQK